MDSLSGSSSPLVALPFEPASPRLPLTEPFTPAMAARAGVGRAALDRLHREGRVRRLLRGVYVDATVPVSTTVRARALALVVGGQLVVGTTAAWLYGVEVHRREGGSPVPIEVHARVRQRYVDRPTRYAAQDMHTVDGVRCTTPLRTALDLGRLLSADRALAALDGLLRLGAFSHTALMAELPRFGGQAGIVQLRELAASADARAEGAAESVLRLRWLHGRLPTPTPGLSAPRPGAHRLAIGLEAHRFGAVLAGRLSEVALAELVLHGWRVVVLGADRVLGGDPTFVTGHLEREFHLHLLDQVG